MTDIESGAAALSIAEGDATQTPQSDVGQHSEESGATAPNIVEETLSHPEDPNGSTQDNEAKDLLRTSDASKSEDQNDSTGLTRAKVEALGNKVRISDSDPEANLELFCYLGLSLSDAGDIVNCRGVVFSGNEIVLHAYPHQTELCARY